MAAVPSSKSASCTPFETKRGAQWSMAEATRASLRAAVWTLISVDLDSGRLDDLPPLRAVLDDELRVLLVRGRERLDAHLAERIEHVGRSEGFHDFRVQPPHDVARRSRRREHPQIGSEIVAGQPALGGGRQGGEARP